MLLTPRYDGPPIIELDGEPDDQHETLVRQRRRLADVLAGLSAEQWAAPSRCDGWTVRDVIAHLTSTNGFWAATIQMGLAGQPSRFLASFDPAATPEQLVEPMRTMSTSELHAGFVESNDTLAETVAGLDGAGWTTLAEAPPGHLPVRLVAHHALWDAWVHERDVMLPLGLVPDEEPDEVMASLRYVAALGPAFAVTTGTARGGSMVLDTTDLGEQVVVDVDGDVVRVGRGPSASAPLLRGRAVDLAEMLSIRAPIDQPVPADQRWLLGGLAQVFDVEPQFA